MRTLLVCIIGIPLFLFVLMQVGVRTFYHYKIGSQLSAAEQAQMDEILEEKVNLPEEWLVAEPFSDELMVGAKNVYAAYNQDNFTQSSNALFRKFFDGDDFTLTEEEWIEVRQILSDNRELINAYSEVANLPGYELEGLVPDSDELLGYVQIPDFLMIQRGVKLLALQSADYARSGNWDRALEANLDILKLSVRHPASLLISHLVAIVVESKGSKSMARIVAECDDIYALENGLREMNELDPLINIDSLGNCFLIDTIGSLRGFKREGYPVELVNNQRGIYYFEQNMEAMSGGYARWQLEHLPLDDPRRAELNIVPSLFGDASLNNLRNLKYLALGDVVNKILLSFIAMPNLDEAQIREDNSKVHFDLARLAIASRITQLETGALPIGQEEFTPSLFPEGLHDPYTDSNYLFDPTGQIFYSVGPKQQDEGNRLLYDPTNGTISPGNISFVWQGEYNATEAMASR